MVGVYQHKISIYLSTCLSIYLSISAYIYIYIHVYTYIYISPFVVDVVALSIRCLLRARTHRPSMEQAKHVVFLLAWFVSVNLHADKQFLSLFTFLSSSVRLWDMSLNFHLNSNTHCSCPKPNLHFKHR